MNINVPSLDDVEFMQECFGCNGTGKQADGFVCDFCEGVDSRVITPVGERLLKFLVAMGIDVPEGVL